MTFQREIQILKALPMATYTKARIRKACLEVLDDPKAQARDKMKAASILAAMIQQKRFSPRRTPLRTTKRDEQISSQAQPAQRIADVLADHHVQ